MSGKKFKNRSDLETFKALQQYGELSIPKLSRKARIRSTTLYEAMQRIAKRAFYVIKAVPNLAKFSEIPMAFISYHHLDAVRLSQLRERFSRREEVRGFVEGEKQVLLFLMARSPNALLELVLEISDTARASPSLRITSPSIRKLDLLIPNSILDEVYRDLPDRRRK